MRGMTVTLLGLVAFGLLFVGSRAEGETTAPSVPDVANSKNPGGDSKRLSKGQGKANPAQSELSKKFSAALALRGAWPNGDPFIRPDNDPFRRPDNDPFNRPDDDPFNRPDNDPFRRPDNDPFNRPDNGGGGGLRCYVCGLPIPCATDKERWPKSGPCVACVKADMEDRGQKRTVRQCATAVDHSRAKMECQPVEDSTVCLCSSDLCNASSVPSLAGFLAILCAVAILWKPF